MGGNSVINVVGLFACLCVAAAVSRTPPNKHACVTTNTYPATLENYKQNYLNLDQDDNNR